MWEPAAEVDRDVRSGRVTAHIVDMTHWRDEIPIRYTTSLAVRRAIVGTLLRAGRPMRVAELTAAVLAARPIRWRGAELDARKVSDVLRHQQTLGRVRSVGRGVWEAVPTAFSRTTRWRYERWEQVWDRDRIVELTDPDLEE